MMQGAFGRKRVVVGTFAVLLACGGFAAVAVAEDGWDGISANFGQSRGVNQAIEQYDEMSRTQASRSSQHSQQSGDVGATDMRATRRDRNRDGVVDVREQQGGRDRVMQLDQDGQSQSGDRHGASHSKSRRHQ